MFMQKNTKINKMQKKVIFEKLFQKTDGNFGYCGKKV